MSIFRLQEHVPDVYPRKSRDFQLLCNLYDCVNDGVKYDIDSITQIVDTRTCSASMIPLLQTKLGFFCNKEYSTEQLRTVLAGFQHAVKYKGSRKGVLEGIQLYLKAQGVARGSNVSIINRSTNREATSAAGEYIIDVGIESEMLDTSLLTDILRYILPAGYNLEYSFYSGYDQSSEIDYEDKVTIVFVSKSMNDGVRLDTVNCEYFKDNKCILPDCKFIDYSLLGNKECIFFNTSNKSSYDFHKSGINYELVNEKPDDWAMYVTNYFTYDEEKDEYILVIPVLRNPLPSEGKNYYYKDTKDTTKYLLADSAKDEYDGYELWSLDYKEALIAPEWEDLTPEIGWYSLKDSPLEKVIEQPQDWKESYINYVIVRKDAEGRYDVEEVVGVPPTEFKEGEYFSYRQETGEGALLENEKAFDDYMKEYKKVYTRTATSIDKEYRYPDFKSGTYYTANIDYMNVGGVGTTHTVSRTTHDVNSDKMEVIKHDITNDTGGNTK